METDTYIGDCISFWTGFLQLDTFLPAPLDTIVTTVLMTVTVVPLLLCFYANAIGTTMEDLFGIE